ncbi:hypothetical protein JOF53_006224 [Crossiella equi]|uniref:ESX secretion-associated protein EspG n=1 Tax=Crossiella equi TaxID=130796 RepID=A0ABS5AL97_9PSEU|nr:ESX secretion-associated protein EspG [Crossiella equi]MBP2477352.1 hypothetical protein [Crossiella equi]
MLRTRVVVSALAYDVVWEAERLGDKHNALLTASPGATWEQRLEYARAALRELTEAGLADGESVHPDLVAALRLLARPQHEVYGWFTPEPGSPAVGVLAAASGTDAVLAVLHDGWLTLEPVEAGKLPEAVARLLPERNALRTTVLSFPLDESTVDEQGLLRRVGGRDGGAARAQRLFERERLGAGQFRVARRDGNGVREIAEFPLDYVDTEAGRYLACRQPGPDGAPWGLVLPGTPTELVQRLRGQLQGPLTRPQPV